MKLEAVKALNHLRGEFVKGSVDLFCERRVSALYGIIGSEVSGVGVRFSPADPQGNCHQLDPF